MTMPGWLKKILTWLLQFAVWSRRTKQRLCVVVATWLVGSVLLSIFSQQQPQPLASILFGLAILAGLALAFFVILQSELAEWIHWKHMRRIDEDINQNL